MSSWSISGPASVWRPPCRRASWPPPHNRAHSVALYVLRPWFLTACAASHAVPASHWWYCVLCMVQDGRLTHGTLYGAGWTFNARHIIWCRMDDSTGGRFDHLWPSTSRVVLSQTNSLRCPPHMSPMLFARHCGSPEVFVEAFDSEHKVALLSLEHAPATGALLCHTPHALSRAPTRGGG